MSTICPGQDTRYWRPTDIFEIPCASCGAVVEFFKDDVRRRCHGCGGLVQNPKITLGCAQWCEHAKKCLGYDPKEAAAEAAVAGSLLDRLLGVVRRELGDEERVARAVALTDEVEALLAADDSPSRRLVVASALLGAVASEREALQTLAREVGLDDATAAEVVDLASGTAATAPERLVLGDARRLVDLRRALRDGASVPSPDGYATAAGRERAAKLAAGAA
jgi:hypothetical protein